MAQELRFGMVGLGVASTQVMPEIAQHPSATLTAACDVNRPHALEQFRREYGGNAYESMEEMCRDPRVDAVYIGSPNHLHKEHAIVAAEHGKHIIIEKPMARTLEECDAINEAVARHGVKLLCGHTHSFDAPYQKMREIVRSGELGPLRQVIAFYYNEFMYRARMPQELTPELGGNVVFNQGPHQVDVVRMLGGGKVRSVRAMTGAWEKSRRAEGAWAAYLEFEDGTPALMGYNGYAHFDSGELYWWVGEEGQPRHPETNVEARRTLAGLSPEEESALKESYRYGGERQGTWLQWDGRTNLGPAPYHPFFGFFLVSCERADLRQSPQGLFIYDDDGKREITFPTGLSERGAEVEELYRAVVDDRPVKHGGEWGTATLEVVLGIMESARLRKEVYMSRQVEW